MTISASQVIEYKVLFPESRYTPISPPANKPRAEISYSLEDGSSRRISVPVRVARAFIKDKPVLPQKEELFIENVRAVESRICSCVLIELLSRRDHASSEVRIKLKRHGFKSTDIEQAISNAMDLHYLDDTAFVISFIEERKGRGWGRRKIEAELLRRGTSLDMIPGYPDAFFNRKDDMECAQRLLTRKASASSKSPEKLIRYLMGRGFSYKTAREAVDCHNENLKIECDL